MTMKAPAETIADRIRRVIRAHKMNQGEFAERAGMAASQFSVLLRRLDERPHSIELETVFRLSEAGDVLPRWLLLGEGQPLNDRDEAEAPRSLRALPEWEQVTGHLRERDSKFVTDMLHWIGQVALPIKHSSAVTPEVIDRLVQLFCLIELGVADASPADKADGLHSSCGTTSGEGP